MDNKIIFSKRLPRTVKDKNPISEKELKEYSKEYGVIQASPEVTGQSQTFLDQMDEMFRNAFGESIQERDIDSVFSLGGFFGYKLENVISTHPWFPFVSLWLFFGGLVFIFALLWKWVVFSDSKLERYSELEPDEFDYIPGKNMWDAEFTVLQMLMGLGYIRDAPGDHKLRLIYLANMFFGLFIFAVMVGIITDAISSYMTMLDRGRSRVTCKNHTLILGWNEATLRTVVQICFLRRGYILACNRSIFSPIYYFLPFLKMKASTSCANNPIVLMNNRLTKADMMEQLSAGLASRGINPNRTKVGKDVIVRCGDPTSLHDLVRVGAHNASAILTMLSIQDDEERESSDGRLRNGYTMRCMLALRSLILTSVTKQHISMMNPDLRIVMQLMQPLPSLESAIFVNKRGGKCCYPVDLRIFLNSLLFKCAATPGLGKVILSILNFEGASIRRRKVRLLRRGSLIGRTFKECLFLFKDTIPIGVVDANEHPNFSQGSGIVPDWNRIFKDSDLLIFISSNATPKSQTEFGRKPLDNFTNEAQDVREEHILSTAGCIISQSDLIDKRKRQILLCGWRPVWFEDPARFVKRLGDLGASLKPGSIVVFINGIEEHIFESFWRSSGLSMAPTLPLTQRVYNIPNTSGVHAYHYCGDSSTLEDMTPLVDRFDFDTAVVLGSLAYGELSAYSQDTRVMSTMLHLRYLSDYYKKDGINLIGENQEDQTSLLALAPRDRTDTDGDVDISAKESTFMAGASNTVQERDFINTQAIYARTLVQTLAYPLISPLINELMMDTPGLPNIGLFPVRAFAIPHIALKFGVIQALCLDTTHNMNCICVGIQYGNGTTALAIDPYTEIILSESDRLVCITKEYEEGSCFPNLIWNPPKCPAFHPFDNCQMPSMPAFEMPECNYNNSSHTNGKSSSGSSSSSKKK